MTGVMTIVFFLMLLLHILDDFVLQSASLSKLKQAKTWEAAPRKYIHDYIAALVIHGLSWSIMIHLPLMYMQLKYNYINGSLFIFISVIFNGLCHARVDHAKANEKTINLVTDQLCHLFQILLILDIWFIGFAFPAVN